MPAFTANRNYPYSVPTDPADVPTALQSFAEAVDADIQALKDTVKGREVGRVRGTGAFLTSSAGGNSSDLPYSFADIVTTPGLFMMSANNTRVTPLLPGFWFVVGSVAYPRTTSGTPRNGFGVRLRRNAMEMVQNINHLPPSASDGIRTISLSTGMPMNGTTDFWVLEFETRTASSTTDTYIVNDRSLTFIRMGLTP